MGHWAKTEWFDLMLWFWLVLGVWSFIPPKLERLDLKLPTPPKPPIMEPLCSPK